MFGWSRVQHSSRTHKRFYHWYSNINTLLAYYYEKSKYLNICLNKKLLENNAILYTQEYTHTQEYHTMIVLWTLILTESEIDIITIVLVDVYVYVLVYCTFSGLRRFGDKSLHTPLFLIFTQSSKFDLKYAFVSRLGY